MPKLWNDTIEAHRRDVQNAVLDTTVALVAREGLRSVTMSQIADRAGIGRATLYKYFPDVESILAAWHERQVEAHLGHLEGIAGQPGEPMAKLEAALAAYAQMAHGSRAHDPHVVAFLHRNPEVARAERRVQGLVRDLIAEAVRKGDARRDVSPDELAVYCLHALAGTRALTNKAARARLLQVTMDALRPAR